MAATAPLFGWVPPSQRTREMEEAHDDNIKSMPKFAIKGKTRYGKRANFMEFSRVANGGKHLPPFKQIKGSCVGNGFGGMLWKLAAIQRVKLGDMISMDLPFWLLPYGRGRELSNMRSKGDGSTGSGMARAAKEFGTAPSTYAGLPKWSMVEGGICFGGAKEVSYSTTVGIPKDQIAACKPHLVRTVAPVRTADDIRDALVNGHGVTIASDWGGMMKCQVQKGLLMNRKVTRWPHQMHVADWWEHDEAGEVFWIQNSWGSQIHGVCPSGAPLGGFWVAKGDMDYIARQGDSFAFSSFVGFPAQDMELDFFV